MAGIGQFHIARFRIQQAADHGDKHAVNSSFAELPVDGGKQHIGFVNGFSEAAKQAGSF